MSDTFVVGGGDAAGMSAASKAKREDPDLEVVAFERGEWVSYAACGMPYYVKGEVDELDDLVAVTPEEFREERGVDLRTGAEVVVADRESERLLGATVVGREGAKRIDTVATALTSGMTVTELRNADLAYAPPFSPVWDPILTAAKVLGGKLERP